MTADPVFPLPATRLWSPDDDDAVSTFDAVIKLHRESSGTLGHLPFAAFKAAGRKGQLVLGLLQGEVAGYVLFSTPRQHIIRLVHVCVDAQSRHSGLAKTMVDRVIDENSARTMITAHCRTDYGLNAFWQSLDMSLTGTRPGRALAGSTLDIWTRRIGQLDLFESAFYDSVKPKAVLDSNILIDLHSSAEFNRPEREESQGLEADWVAGEVEFTFSPEVDGDIAKLQPKEEGDRVREALAGYVKVRREPAMRATAAELLNRMPSELVESDASLAEDARHLADAVLARADYFVSRDSNLLAATAGWLEPEFAIEVLRPVDLIQRLMPPAPPDRFRSEQLESVGLLWQRVASVSQRLEDAFLDRHSNEKGTHFRKQVQALLAHPEAVEVQELTDEKGRQWALVAWSVAEKLLSIPLLRVGTGSMGETIGFQLVRYLRARALKLGCESIAITDPALSPVIRASLDTDGFEGSPPAARLSWFPPVEVTFDTATPTEVSSYERTHWPQVLPGSDLPLQIVPIQPKYARELIGYNDTLLNTREKLALGFAREVAYFCSPRGSWEVPSRVLWYVTKDPKASATSAVRAIVAHSRVVDATTLPVAEAIERHRNVGILRQREIEGYAKNGRVSVLRVEDTQLLEEPIGRKTLSTLFSQHGVKGHLQTTRRVAPALFDSILSLDSRRSA